MKKRLLITSIVMMLVVAVALSTATYAWFTSSASVTASTVNLTAATNDAAALGIGWTGGAAGTYIIADDDATAGGLKPMAPAFLLAGATASDVTFYSATITTENGTEVFNGTVDNTIQPYTFKNGSAESFYIKNLSQGKAVSNVTVTASFNAGYKLTTDTTFQSGTTYYTKDTKGFYQSATVTNGESVAANTYYVADAKDGSALIRIAVFTKMSTESTYTLRGVLSKSPAENDTIIAYAANNASSSSNIVAGNATADCAKVTSSSSVSLLPSGSLAINTAQLNNAASQVDVIVKVWYDGIALNDITAGSRASINLTFNAVA